VASSVDRDALGDERRGQERTGDRALGAGRRLHGVPGMMNLLLRRT
jgi:hypothetical protein